MSTERMPGNPGPEDQRRKSREEVKKEADRDYKRTFRPVRLYVTPFERSRANPTAEVKERFYKVWEKVLERAATNPDFFAKLIADLRADEQDTEKIKAAHAQFTPLTPEEVEVQDGDGVINLVKTAPTMSGKINLVEKLQPEQLDTLRQRDPSLEPVITGLAKRPARKEKAERRILDIYQRRGEDGRRP
jgi:hypothetical protein